MVHPQCRGYVHKTALLFNSSQSNSSDLRTQMQIRPSSLIVHSAAVPFLQSLSCALSCSSFLTKPSTHTAAEVVHAHSWDLTLKPKIDLNSLPQMILVSLDTFDIFT